MRLWWLVAISCLIASGADKAFEVVSIRIAMERDPDYYKQLPGERNDPKVQITAGLVSLPYENMGTLLRRAFDLPIPQVVAPGWARTEKLHYAIVAKVPEGATEKDVPEMLRSMLAQRFGMTYHHETRPTQALVLTLAKGGLKAKPADHPAPVHRGYRRDSDGSVQRFEMAATSGVLASWLSNQTHLLVIDQTGLTGIYSWACDFRLGGKDRAARSNDFLLDLGYWYDEGLQEMGVRLQPTKVPLDNVIIDKLEKMPTEN